MDFLSRLFRRKAPKSSDASEDKAARLRELSRLVVKYLKEMSNARDIKVDLKYGAPRIQWIDADKNGKLLYLEGIHTQELGRHVYIYGLYDYFIKNPNDIKIHIADGIRNAHSISWNEEIISSAFAYVARNLPENVWRAYIYQETKWETINYDVASKIRKLLNEIHPPSDLREEGHFFVAFRSYISRTTLGQRPFAPFQQYHGKFGVVFDQSDISKQGVNKTQLD